MIEYSGCPASWNGKLAGQKLICTLNHPEISIGCSWIFKDIWYHHFIVGFVSRILSTPLPCVYPKRPWPVKICHVAATPHSHLTQRDQVISSPSTSITSIKPLHWLKTFNSNMAKNMWTADSQQRAIWLDHVRSCRQTLGHGSAARNFIAEIWPDFIFQGRSRPYYDSPRYKNSCEIVRGFYKKWLCIF